VTVAIEVKNDAVEQDKKRKRNLSEDSTTKETPKNKRAKLANNRTGEPASEDIVPVLNLATNLFAKFSENSGGSPSRKQKKNQDASILVTACIAAEKNQESTIVLEDVGQRSIREWSPEKTASKKERWKKTIAKLRSPLSRPKNLFQNQMTMLNLRWKVILIKILEVHRRSLHPKRSRNFQRN
jgi:hypothetical protein